MIKNFFNISDLNKNDFYEILKLNSNNQNLSDKHIGLIFEKYSTRTRLSFNVAISSLGGKPIDIRFEELNFSRDESFEDTFKAMNCYLDGLIYRTSSHSNLINSSKYFEKPIINALSELSHPCQILSDIFTLQEHFKTLDLTILWTGDMNNVCFSLIEAANLIEDLRLIICSPKSISSQYDWFLKSNVKIIDNLKSVDLKSVNCVMTDVFISMNDKDSNEKLSILKDYSVNSELMSQTHPNSIFMHCLPAKVGLEVTEEVFRSSKSIVWKQAYNRMLVQRNLLQYIYQ